MPQAASHVYATTITPDGWTFVPILRGLYMRCHVCVVQVACSYCDAKVGEPCRGSSGFPMGMAHKKRHLAAAKNIGRRSTIRGYKRRGW